jgi:glycosyltransferase involved in cell wall biosynthesis
MYLTLRLAGVKFRATVYDSDGLAIQERIETGVWKKFGVKALVSKSIELLGIISADKILVRSQETIRQITSRRFVIGKKLFCVLENGRDTEMFSPATYEDRQRIRTELGFNAQDFIVIYVGTIGDQYMVPEMRRLFQEIRTQVVNTKFLILTYAQDEVIKTYFGSEEQRLNNEIYVLKIAPDLVGRAICIGDVGITLRLPLPSMEHVAPLKYREYLLSGVPVIYSGRTGDHGIVSNVLARQLDHKRTNSYVEIASWVSTKLVNNREQIRLMARQYGLEKFDISTDSIKLTRFLNEN